MNNPINYTDPSGHCIFGLDTAACIAIGLGVLKVVDYGWTAWDTLQAHRVIADPNSSRNEKLMAGLTVGLSVLFEILEPDDIFPVSLPLDDVARHSLLRGAKEALEEGGDEGLEFFLRDQLGDHADEVLEKLGLNTSTFSSPQKLTEHFRKHGAEFGYATADEYLEGARNLVGSGDGVATFTRNNGDQLFYKASSNEFAVQGADGAIRTYFKPEKGIEYWLNQIGGP